MVQWLRRAPLKQGGPGSIPGAFISFFLFFLVFLYFYFNILSIVALKYTILSQIWMNFKHTSQMALK